ncbi:MAG: glutamate racemase [Candidatus Xenobiia bacterium LiM19]
MIEPIGISDSGVGGLSVASKIMAHLPSEEILYYGDTANVPYGEKSPEQIKKLVFRIVDFFMSCRVKAVVMACNSSSALVLDDARKHYDVPIIGVIEPAVREALRISPGKKIGLIANAVTVKSGAHQSMITNISRNGVRIAPMPCPRLVPLVEQGRLEGLEAESAVREYVLPLEAQGIDTLILGCTHYPFLEKTINKVLKRPIYIVDPAEFTALKLRDILASIDRRSDNEAPVNHRFYVSGDPEPFKTVGSMLLGRPLDSVSRLDI